VLAVIGFFRELLGTGGLFGYQILSDTWYTPNQLAILAPGAFIALGFLVAVFNWISGANKEGSGTP
jgi:Na+-transporting NADH:ubiquinone oxidoreductase subunit NqrD